MKPQTMQEFKTEDPEEGDDDLYEHYSFTAGKGQEPLRVDKFLMNFIEKATRNKIQQAAKNGNIEVNGAVVKQNYKVKAGDVVRVLFEHPPYEFLLTPENIPLDIVYEDKDLIVLNKPSGIVMHPGAVRAYRQLAEVLFRVRRPDAGNLRWRVPASQAAWLRINA